MIPVRPTNLEPTFLVGDASGMGFGASKWTQDDSFVRTTHGNWAARITFDASSNYRESANLALEICRMCSKRELPPSSELWVFTDNSTAESTFYKGGSTSPHLHQIVLELQKLDMEGLLIIHFVWFSGKHMIAQDTHGLSRGNLTSWVMAGDNFLKFIPLNETAFEREPKLDVTIQSWLPDKWRITFQHLTGSMK